MSGMGGWVAGTNVHSVDRLLSLFSEALSVESPASVRTWRSESAGVVVGGLPQASALFSSGGCIVGIFGHPRWIANGESITPLDMVCRRFLEAYKSDRASALDYLFGDFSLVAIDAEANEVMLAIDRFGIRSMAYQLDEKGLIFGSTCDVIRKHPEGGAEIALQAIYDYTYFHVVPGPETIYRRQSRLLPGHCLTWKNGKAVVRPYWSMKFAERAGTVADFKPRFREVLRSAVATSVAGTHCGAFLSGGTDSSTVAGTLCDVIGGPAKTYSIGFAVDGYDEMEYARIASRHFGTQQHEYYVTPDDVVDALPKIAAAYDQPFGNASAVAAYYCARLAKSDGISRLLAGDGGDEIFGGNSRYAKQYQLAYYERIPAPLRQVLESVFMTSDVMKHIPLLRKVRSYIEQAHRPMPARYDSYNLIDRLGPKNLFTLEFLSQIDLGSPLKLLSDCHKNYRDASLINQMLGIDLKITLGDSDLPKVTRMCELAGVEVAFPLLDESLVEFSGILPEQLKLRGNQLRYFFKEALRDFLPDEILRKQKHGFGLPAGEWLTTHPRLKALAGDSLSSLKSRGIVAPAFIDRLLGEHLRTHAAYYGTMAWVLMMLELWFQKHAST